MPYTRTLFVAPGRIAGRLLLVGLLLGLAACRGGSAGEAFDPGSPDELEVVRLDPAEWARLAAEVGEAVAAEVLDGFELELWAPELLVKDPIALSVDNQGRVHVTGSSRGSMLLDIRRHHTWRRNVLSFQTVEDWQRFIRDEYATPERSEENEWLPDFNEDGVRDWRDLTVQKERVYRIEDTSGDGRADLSRIMMVGFNTEVHDVAGGLLAHDGEIFVAAAPEVWRLRDRSGDGVIDSGEVISRGYGVHRGFSGHGMSGIKLGPDGRIYWSVGDMGFNVEDGQGRRHAYPNQGAIFRANPDGSGFEVFATGLRNTHEYSFDEFGNLISVDNDGDHPGEHERLVYVVDGSDSGWRTNWQLGKYTDPDNNPYNVWMDEGLYRPRFEGQAAFITPPIAAYHAGPTGMAYNPGTALSERWRNHFFMSSFRGSPSNSQITAFQLTPRGAGFELTSDTVIVRGVLATGLDFGPDGALYVADWVQGWEPTGTGRIWKLDTPEARTAPIRAETRALLAEAFDRRSEADLAGLLRHADMRVRLKAQHELARRRAGARTLLEAARQPEHQLARLHGLWGLGQLARQNARQAEPLVAFLGDADAEVRAQAAKTLGDVRHAAAADALVPLLRDGSERVRFFAAEALGRIGHRAAVQPLVTMLQENDDRDAFLRHAGSLALARIGDAQPVVALADHPSRAVRIAAVVALRRMQDPGVARFLGDADEYVVTETARAINDDGGIEAALPELARMLEQQRFTGEPLLRRAISANQRLATAEASQRLAAFAVRSGTPETLRVEAVASLGTWPRPSAMDRVDGMWHGPAEHDASLARSAIAPLIEPLLARGTPTERIAVTDAAGRLQIRDAVPALMARLQTDRAPEVRVAALNALYAIRTERMEEAVRVALADGSPEVRMVALSRTPELGLPEATTTELLASVLQRGTVEERQSALAALGRLRGPDARRVLDGLVDQLQQRRLAAELQLDLMEAVEATDDPGLNARLAQFRSARPAGDPVAAFGETLQGGDQRRGRQIVHQNASAQCARCHVFDDSEGEVGPSLYRVGARLDRRQLLQALVDPNARIAPGYGMVILTLRDGRSVSGMLREETASHLVVQTGDGESQRLAKAEIAERTDAASGMPAMQHLLSRREIRDVVEYLSTLK
jgi:quinoprotein glucose dehydrogenase